ncbi:hypothetical protein RBSWK_01735 [Rhodopirellula baltica SWK14]|uniref:Uncharacterized protein n=1 Tax=Rhodopirellula baltica SWK14 TaxID=993516 RepID=L7CMR4_RHOBT|nr:hypothetical protein RBSWK_01735 [Rhodopirellula baltica SWK14]
MMLVSCLGYFVAGFDFKKPSDGSKSSLIVDDFTLKQHNTVDFPATSNASDYSPRDQQTACRSRRRTRMLNCPHTAFAIRCPERVHPSQLERLDEASNDPCD